MRPSLRQVFLAIVAAHTAYEGGRARRRYPDGTARDGANRNAERLEERRARREQERRLSWSDVFLAQVGVAMAAPPDSPALEEALRRVSAVAAAWLEDLQARRLAREQAGGPPPPGTVLHVRLPPRSLVYRAVVRPNGKLWIPILRREVHFSDVQVQQFEAEDAEPTPTGEPLRGVIDTQLDTIRRRGEK